MFNSNAAKISLHYSIVVVLVVTTFMSGAILSTLHV